VGMVCVIPGCRRQQVNVGRALCWLHYKHHLAIGRFCTIEGCDRPLRNAGLCTGHYRQRRDGVPLTPIAERREPGTGSINRLGYKEITVAPKVRRLEHRVVMEQILGRELKSTEHVHHRNGDRLDNRPQNLELWTIGQPNGQRVRDLLDWLARDYPALFISHAVTAVKELEGPAMRSGAIDA
jgi:HNH endonuclease